MGRPPVSDYRAPTARQAPSEALGFDDRRLGRLEERIYEFSAGLAEALSESGFSPSFVFTTVSDVRNFVQVRVFRDLNRRRSGRAPAHG